MSTNISKLKRDDLLLKISKIEEFLKQNSNDANAQQLFGYLGELKKEVNGKKYGLVFEEHRESIDDILQNNLPVLSEQQDLFIDNGGQVNFLIEGDNLASLHLLQKTHKGKVDLIYIDPPYNTGSEDFVYDDDYVDKEDNFKHSKWISFMQKRLKFAHNVLSENGLIFISINEIEQAQLKLILDNIFGAENLLEVFHIQTRYSDKDVANNGAEWLPLIEYVFIYAKNKFSFDLNRPTEDYDFSPYHFEIKELKKGFFIDMNGKKVEVFKKGDYEILNQETSDIHALKEVWASGSLLKQKNTAAWYYNEYLLSRLKDDGTDTLYKIYNIGEDGLGYRYVKAPSKADKTRGKIYQGAPEIQKNAMLNNSSAKKHKPIINFYDFSPDYGNITSEGNVPFGSGKKPIKMLKQFFNYHKGKDITILDFFAGSGSTGHAVLSINSEDNGNRKFILCTNNENNICREKTYQRLKNVIQNDALPGSLKYFRVDFVPISEAEYYEYADKLLLHVRELVELENALNFSGNKSLAILLTEDELEEFCKGLKEIPKQVRNDGAQVGNDGFASETYKTAYIGHDILMSKAQKDLFKTLGIKINIIPEYYYPELNG